MLKRAYHYSRLYVATSYDKGCLNPATIIIRKRDLENDEEYLALAKMYWMVQGEDYDLKEDHLWIDVDWSIDHQANLAKNRYHLAKPCNPGYFGVNPRLHDLWKYAKEDKNPINREIILKYLTSPE